MGIFQVSAARQVRCQVCIVVIVLAALSKEGRAIYFCFVMLL